MIIQYIVIGLGAGLLAGMFGIGGGIVIVPVLILFFGWTAQEASGTSLAALMLPAGLMAILQYRKAGMLNIKASALIALGIFCGSFFGANIALSLDNALLKQVYGVFLVWVGWKFAQPMQFIRGKEKQKTEPYRTDIGLYIYPVTGVAAGICAGMFGIGGGVIITTILIGLLKMEPKKAVAMSLTALLLPSGFPGVYMYYQNNYINIAAAILIAIGIELGSAISARIAINTSADIFKKLYGIFVFLIGIYFILAPWTI